MYSLSLPLTLGPFEQHNPLSLFSPPFFFSVSDDHTILQYVVCFVVSSSTLLQVGIQEGAFDQTYLVQNFFFLCVVVFPFFWVIYLLGENFFLVALSSVSHELSQPGCVSQGDDDRSPNFRFFFKKKIFTM